MDILRAARRVLLPVCVLSPYGDSPADRQTFIFLRKGVDDFEPAFQNDVEQERTLESIFV